MPGYVIPNDDLQLVFTAIECASSTLRLRMPSSNNIETMFVQHYLEKGSHRSGNVIISHQPEMMPQVVLQDDESNWQ
jgi:hypothetical protein